MADECELPRVQATSAEIRSLLATAKTVAVVGISDKPDRPSYRVASYLRTHGYRIFPVNPALSAWAGIACYSTLREVPEPIDVVDIFRNLDAVPGIVDEAIAIGAKAIWMQEGIIHNDAAERAKAAGLVVVMNKCMLKEHASQL